MALNFGWYSFLGGLPYASDLTWSKIMIILAGNIVGQLGGAIGATVLVISEQVEKAESCYTIMQALYIRQYVYIIANFFMILFQATSLSRMYVAYNVNT